MEMDELHALYDAAIAGDADAKAKLDAETEYDYILNVNGETILHVESIKGNAESVRFILREFANKNLLARITLFFHTPLHLAIYGGHTEVAEIIIEAASQQLPVTTFQSFLRVEDYCMDTALHFAVMQGNVSIVKVLVEADPTHTYIQNKEGKTPIYIAAEYGHNDIVKVLCTTCTAPLNFDGPGGNTALHAASKNLNNGIEMVEVLIDAARSLPSASDIDSSDDYGNPVSCFQAFLRRVDEDLNTALHIAVMHGNLDTAKLLVEADPSYPGIRNNKGHTPFYIAAETGYGDMVKMICTTCTATPLNLGGPSGGGNSLHAVIKNLDEAKNEVRDVIKMIFDIFKDWVIREGPQLDECDTYMAFSKLLLGEIDEYGQTILEVAVEQNYVTVVELILDVQKPEYDVVQKGFISLVPLIYKAKDKEYEDLGKVLAERYDAGAEITTSLKSRGFGNQVRLMSAIVKRQTEIVFSLLDADARSLVTFVDNLGWTALHHAVYHEFNSIIKLIVESQKEFEPKFLYRDKVSTPFHIAAEKGYTSTVILLMQVWPSSSSSYISVDKNGQNILHLAALQSKKEMIHGILRYCPEEYKKELVNKQDNDGNIPLHLLIKRGCLVPELLKFQEFDTSVKNKEGWTPSDMLYVQEQMINDQVKIKVALDHIQIDQKRDIFSSSVFTASERERKDVNFRKEAQQMIDGKLALMKEDTRAIAKCFANAIAGDPISRAAVEMEADLLNEAGETMLHVESKKGVVENVRFIVSALANKKLLVKLDNQKQTALYLAADRGHAQVVEALLDAARRNLPSASANDDTLHNPISSFQDFIRQANGQMGNTALHLAVLTDNVAIVKLLVKADPNDSHVPNNEGKTPVYIAAENGFKDVVKEMCTTCAALSLDGPGGRTTALHALIQNVDQVTDGESDVIGMMVVAAKRWSTGAEFEALFCKTDELGSTVLQLVVERNNADAVRLILHEDPACQHGREIKRNGLMRLIYKAIDNGDSDEIVKLLCQTYQVGISHDHKDALELILAIKRRDEDVVLRLLEGARDLVTFTEDNGWTLLHYAVYHEFDSVLGAIIEAKENVGHQFVYENMEQTPFHVAVECGYASTLVRLMQSWPPLSSASKADNSPYTVVNKDDQNILHLAAADNRKEMVEGILKYCPEMYKDEILKQQDTNGDTPLHVLISHGCFIPELIIDKGLDTMAKNKKIFTPWEMLYLKNDVVADQVRIKIAIDNVLTNQSAWNIWAKSTEKRKDIWKNIPESKRRIKDVIFEERKKSLMDTKNEERRKKLERYKLRTNTQIIVTALITTVTFTVGFTMPGGLRQSGEVDEGLVVLTKKTAFHAFMVSDALALLLSTSSLFFYFLESMYEDPHQVSKLNAASTVLNIVSVVAMMLTFIAGTYLVLSHSPALAITICIIGALFFLLIIILLIKIVYDRLHVKRDLD